MQMWLHWWSVVSPLRAACSRQRTFLWLATALAGFCVRDDLLGVTSLVRALGLAARCYQCLLKCFHSPAVDLSGLTQVWTRQVLRLFPVHRFAGRPVLLGDGIKIGKCGRHMPAVKHLHQESDGNTKPEFIMGHSVQVISMLGRGRARVFGEKLKLWSFFEASPDEWQQADSPVYGERGVTIRFLCRDLMWRPLHRIVRFVLVDHPTRGRLIFIVTDLSMPGIEVIRLYGLRFKIELSFKQALRVIGVYAYHFWMQAMVKLPRCGGTQHLHRKTDRYRHAVRRKIRAYHLHIQLGLIAQGILQYLAVTYPRQVWNSFGSWLRTIRPGIPPSEFVTSAALRNALPDFLAQRHTGPAFKKFLRDNIELGNYDALRLAG